MPAEMLTNDVESDTCGAQRGVYFVIRETSEQQTYYN